MGIAFAVHTYRYVDSMFYILNGIKMIMNSDFTTSIIKLMALITTGYYGILGMYGANNVNPVRYFLKTIGMLLVVTSLIMPKADILVVDRISGKKELISDLPYAFVLPVGIMEACGAAITSLFERAFAPVSSMPYSKYGLIFGHRIVQESRNWRINNPEFIRNMDTYLKRCVVVESMIGTRFTPMELYNTDDIYSLVSSRAGVFREVVFYNKNQIKRLNCKQASLELKNYFQTELDFLKIKYKGTEYNIAGNSSSMINNNLNAQLKKNLEIGYSGVLGVDASSLDIIRQNMMINSIKDFNNKSDLYGYTRSLNLQNNNWKISSELAKEYLPLLLNIMKGLIYASFIFIVPLMILSGGLAKYKKYCILVFSLQIWPALNAVLNLFIELYSSKLAGITTGGMTYSNFDQAHNAVDTIILVASGLQMSIPFLSFAIVQGGVGSFIHLANSIGSASMSAASMASSEVASGNRSFDNLNYNNQSIENKSGFKTDWNQSYQENAIQNQAPDGSIIRQFADGSTSITSGVSVNKSSGSRSLFMEEASQSHIQEGINKSTNSINAAEKGYNESKSQAISQAADRISNLAQRQASGENLNIDKTTEEGAAINKVINDTIALSKKEDISMSESARSSLNAYVDGGAGVPKIFPYKFEAGVKLEGGSSSDSSSNSSNSLDNSVTRSKERHESLNTLLRAASSKHYSKDDTIDESLANSIKANYDNMKSYSNTISEKLEEVENYNLLLQHAKNTSVTDRKDMYHDVEQEIMRQYGVTQYQAHQMIESDDKRANEVWNNMVKLNIEKDLTAIEKAKQDIKDNFNNTDFEDRYSTRINDDEIQKINKEAALDNLTIDKMGEKINSMRSNINSTNELLQDNAKQAIKSVENQNIEKVKKLQNEFNEQQNQVENKLIKSKEKKAKFEAEKVK